LATENVLKFTIKNNLVSIFFNFLTPNFASQNNQHE
jgi:hypothetical protein